MAPPAFIARQPIFNHKLNVVGYELLFRGRGYAADALIDDAARATATVVLNTLTELDMDRIVAGKTAWINASREFVLHDLIQAVPPSVVGLEIPETEDFDNEMVEALRELKQAGYKLALDDFRYRDGSDEVLDLFDVVKLSMPELGRAHMRELAARLRAGGRQFPGKVLADKLGTRPDHEVCIAAGYDLFQGYFFCRPAVVGTRGISANRLALLQVVAALNDPAIQLSEIEQLVARDVALSFRLLRYVNSAFFGLRGDVRSIGQALALLGLENVRRWATLSTLATIDNKPTELTLTALIRARFCELAGANRGMGGSAELFTLGLFSVIDGMMDAPMHDVVASLPLAEDMREALVSRRGPMGQLLSCVTELETGEDGPASGFVSDAGDLYLEALMWANSAAESLFGGQAAAPARTRTAPATRRRPRHLAEPTSSTPPPGATDVGFVAAGVPRPRAGIFRRAWARCLALFGRRVSEAHS
ncbi:MAG: HDOD domain-containing protein [Solirubrobacterales bacterium]|nr:HDOD domain-containing protein [Solirubrobacterales bacterium]